MLASCSDVGERKARSGLIPSAISPMAENETSLWRRIPLRVFVYLGALALLVWAGRFAEGENPPTIPERFRAWLPSGCSQVVLVLAPDDRGVKAKLWLMELGNYGWHSVDGPIDCTIGHQGLAWGTGEHVVDKPEGFRTKREGDGCSPAGVFRIPFAFGTAPMTEHFRLPYTQLTPSIVGVDDPKSRYYNQVVDNTKTERDWDSNEAMMRHGKLYELGAFIANNPKNIPGGGSCIFLHVWPGPGKGTAGCTGMPVSNLLSVLLWLDPDKNPCLVQGLEGW